MALTMFSYAFTASRAFSAYLFGSRNRLCKKSDRFLRLLAWSVALLTKILS